VTIFGAPLAYSHSTSLHMIDAILDSDSKFGGRELRCLLWGLI